MTGWYSAPDALDAYEQRRSDRLEAEREQRLAAIREIARAERDRRDAERKAQEEREAEEARRIGRPAVRIGQEDREIFVAALREGRTQEQAARSIGYSSRTVSRVADRDPAFKREIAEAVREGRGRR